MLGPLDDLCACGNSAQVGHFYTSYRNLCEDVGVSLASEEDKDKAFGPSSEGLILGIVYNTDEWTWYIREDKLARIIWAIKGLLDKMEAPLGEVWSVVGKILHVKPLVEPGRHYVGELLRLFTCSKDKELIVILSNDFKRELTWWLLFIQMCATRSRIPSAYRVPPPGTKVADSDASGGTMLKLGNGVGVVIDEYRWTYLPWPKLFNSNAISPCCGMKFRHKMSFLELIGHALRIIAFPDTVCNSAVATLIDNDGSVKMSKKGYCVPCPVTDTLLRMIYEVTAALNGTEYVLEITRCSSRSSIAADAISKASWDTLDKVMPLRNPDPEKIPVSFVKWLYTEGGPKADRDLGEKIIRELKGNGEDTLF